jgi:hypothetical protein
VRECLDALEKAATVQTGKSALIEINAGARAPF